MRLTTPRLVTLLTGEGLRCLIASFIALAVDYGTLVGATEVLHLHYLISAALGFTAGIIANYALSVTVVFRERRLESRWLEMAGFLVIGLLGLVLNEGLMKLFVEGAGISYVFAKMPAASIGFLFNYGMRRAVLFTKARSALGREPARALAAR